MAEYFAQLNHLQRTLRPVMPPADDEIALGGIMPMLEEVTAFKFKFDFDELAFVVADAAHSFAIGKLRLHTMHEEAKLPGHCAKKKDDPKLVDWGVHHGPGTDGPVVNGTVYQR